MNKIYNSTTLTFIKENIETIVLPEPFEYNDTNPDTLVPITWSCKLGHHTLILSLTDSYTLQVKTFRPWIHFNIQVPHRVLSWPTAFQDAESGWIHVLVTTCSSIFYRIMVNPENTKEYHVFWYDSKILSSAIICHFVDLDTVILGCEDGRMVQIDCPQGLQDGEYAETLLQDKGVLSYLALLSSQPRVSKVGNQPISLASICYDKGMTLFSLSRDGKLGIWNLITHSCIKTLNLYPSYNQEFLIHSFPYKYIKIFDEDLDGKVNEPFDSEKAIFKLAVYSPLVGSLGDVITIYSGSVDGIGQLKDLDFIIEKNLNSKEDSTLVDFMILPIDHSLSNALLENNQKQSQEQWSIWTLSNQNRESLLCFSDLNLTSTEIVWFQVFKTSRREEFAIVSDDFTSCSFQEQYLQFIFTRFPLTVIQKALNQMGMTKTKAKSGNETYSETRARAISTIGLALEIPQDSTNPFVSFSESLEVEYCRFLELCKQFHALDSVPSSLAFHGQDKLILSSQNTSIVYSADPISSILYRNPLYLLASDDSVKAWGWSSNLSKKEVRQDMAVFYQLLDSMESCISIDKRVSFECNAAKEGLNSLEYSLGDFTLFLKESFFQEFIQSNAFIKFVGLFSNIKHPFLLIKTLLTSLENGGFDVESSSSSDSSPLLDMESSESLEYLALMSKDLIRNRFKLSAAILQVCILISHVSGESTIRLPMSLVAESLVKFHSLGILNNITHAFINLYPTGVAPDSVERSSILGREIDKGKREIPLLIHLLQHHYILENARFNLKSCLKFINSIGFTHFSSCKSNPSLSCSIQMTPSILLFSNKMIHFGQYKIALNVLENYPKTRGSCFLFGRIYIHYMDYQKAQGYFESALGDASSDLTVILNYKSVQEYYEIVVELFRDVGAHLQVVHFGKLALSLLSLENQNSNVKLLSPTHPVGHNPTSKADSKSDTIQRKESLQKMLFYNLLKSSCFDEAYEIMISLPLGSKLDCLEPFINGLCEQGLYKDLVSGYPFVGLESFVEKTLWFKARTSPNLMREGQCFYKLLYSFYIQRDNYRQACMAMYLYAQCVDLKEKAQCLLVALYTLRLLPSDSAWIAVSCNSHSSLESSLKTSLETSLEMTIGSRELSSFECNPNHEKQGQKILLEQDIKREYTFVLAKLELGLPSTIVPEDAFAVYLDKSLLFKALEFAQVFDLNLSRLFIHLTRQCVELLGCNHATLTKGHFAPSHWEGTIADKNWQLLKDLLESLDSLENGFGYYKAVVETLLNMRIKIPCWLRQFYYRNCPQELLLLLITNEEWDDAFELVKYVSLLKEESRHSRIWNSFHLLDILFKNVDSSRRHFIKSLY